MAPLAIFSYIHEFCADKLGIYSIQNYLEITFLSFTMYKILKWLQQDHTKRLVIHMYSFASILIAAYIFQCSILFWTLLCSIPIISILTIIIHQKQIQKNFMIASSKDLTPQTLPTKNWLDILVRSHLLAAYQNKQIFVIVQRMDPLQHLLTPGCQLQIPTQSEIIELVLQSNALQKPCIIWMTDAGIIYGVNAHFKETLLTELLIPANIYHAAITLIMAKTDALAWTIDLTTKSASLWHQSKTIQQITIDHLLSLCKQILNKKMNQDSFEKPGVSYGVKNHSSHSTSKLH